MTKREPFSSCQKKPDSLAFIVFLGTDPLDVLYEEWAKEYVSRLNKRHESLVKEAVREATRRARMKLHCDLCGGNDRSHTAECPISIAAERTSRRIKSIREAKDGK